MNVYLKTTLIVFLNTLVLLFSVEATSYEILKMRNHDAQFLINRHKLGALFIANKGRWILDPLLGYAHANNDPKIVALKHNYTWKNGFLIYKKKGKDFQKPIILALGGSTTDGVLFGHSWPEELSNILRERGMPGTVINGGVGGYNTNHDLLKLIRDGLEFGPDIVVSYGGWNDRDVYSVLPFPMVSRYQANVFYGLSTMNAPKLFPSTLTLILGDSGQWTAHSDCPVKTQKLRDALCRGWASVNHESNNLDYTLGLPSRRSPPENYERNMRLMHAIASVYHAAFFGVIQPLGTAGNSKISDLYPKIKALPNELPYVIDATAALDDIDGVFRREGNVHLTKKGDRIIAEYIFENIIEPTMAKKQSVVSTH